MLDEGNEVLTGPNNARIFLHIRDLALEGLHVHVRLPTAVWNPAPLKREKRQYIGCLARMERDLEQGNEVTRWSRHNGDGSRVTERR
jgi:hypothetical protein